MTSFDSIKNQKNFPLFTENTVTKTDESGNETIITNPKERTTLFPYISVFKKHAPFGFKFVEESEVSGNVQWGNTVTFIIDQGGDLLHKAYLEIILPNLTGTLVTDGADVRWVNNIAHALISEIKLIIGSQTIEIQDSVWMDIWNEINDEDEYEFSLLGKENSIIGSVPTTSLYDNKTKWYLPLHLFFTKNPALSLPLFLIESRTIKIQITLNSLKNLVHHNGSTVPEDNTAPENPTIRLHKGLYYLSSEEKRAIKTQFQNNGYDFLIEVPDRLNHRTAVTGSSFSVNYIDQLDYPIKELYWVFRHGDRLSSTSPIVPPDQNSTAGNNIFAYYGHSENSTLEGGIGTRDPFTTLEIQIGNTNILDEAKKADYFRTMEPFYHHARLNSKYIYTFSFSLNPLKYDPSGFLFIPNQRMKLVFSDIISTATDYRLNAYTYGYRILRFTKLNKSIGEDGVDNEKLTIQLIKGSGSTSRTRRSNVGPEPFTNMSNSGLRIKPGIMKKLHKNQQKNKPKGPWSGLSGGFSSSIGDNTL